MKKTYMFPEMDVVELKMQQMIMAGSGSLPQSNDEVDEGDILAPGMMSEFDYLFKD